MHVFTMRGILVTNLDSYFWAVMAKRLTIRSGELAHQESFSVDVKFRAKITQYK
jgi:hypothetical protein